MPDEDQTTKGKNSDLNIPDETREEFPELVALVVKSHSMDDEERQYWIDVLPIMTQDQIDNLNDILGNEKKQIDTANKKYKTGMGNAKDKAKSEFDEAAYREKRRLRVEQEKKHEVEEEENERHILEELDDL